jgi:hypothetical protein
MITLAKCPQTPTQGTYQEACNEYLPEDKLNEWDLEPTSVSQIPKAVLHLRPYRMKGGVLTYMCTDQLVAKEK